MAESHWETKFMEEMQLLSVNSNGLLCSAIEVVSWLCLLSTLVSECEAFKGISSGWRDWKGNGMK